MFGSADALAILNVAATLNNLTIVVTGDSRELVIIEESLLFYASGSDLIPVTVFPGWECLPYDNFSPHRDIVSRRMKLLSELPKTNAGILVISVDNLMQKLPPVDYVQSKSFSIAIGDSLQLDLFCKHLEDTSYHNFPQVNAPGEFAVRGGVIDVFPMGVSNPIRIELFGNVIETLRYFDPDTQLTTQKIDKLQVLPASEVPLDKHAIGLFRRGFREHIHGDPLKNRVYQEIKENGAANGAEYYLPLFYDQTSTLLDYLPSSSVFFMTGDLEAKAEQFWTQVNERFEITGNLLEQLPLPPEMLFMKPVELASRIQTSPGVCIRQNSGPADRVFRTERPELPTAKGRGNVHNSLKQYMDFAADRILISVDSFGQRDTLETSLHETVFTRVESWQEFLDSDASRAIAVSKLASGICIPDERIRVITSTEIYGKRLPSQTKKRPTRSPENIIASMEELEIGDPVVHESYGIGRYQGLTTIENHGETSECVVVDYADNGTLYVPVYSLDLIRRYAGNDADNVPLNSLNSKSWSKAQAKAREQAFDVAAELLEIQSLRDLRKGNSLPTPEQIYGEFISRFPYQETPDQESAITAVLDDMHSERPMDRLICGDVGFGKTEVAMRAALIAVANGFQVAVVVPTTLLAQQHLDVFNDRFSEQAVYVELLSRMRTKTTTNEVVQKIQNGSVDIIIGTHRLLQADIQFKRLGLLIIDEEHRFGVRQKEHLKRLRADVDILTMTATPIPRTLSMALNEIRDISIIATPPDNRLSVRTFVRDWSPQLVREACLRELGRGGQIFYVHNEVRTIQSAAREIARIVPEANIGIAHGQMSKLELERVMKNFYLQNFDTLVCSTIIESGIDIPTANTIIIDKASKFGMAQLHQLRGRVGRSHHQAYAYLLVPSREYLKRDAAMRLGAIESTDQLGAGYIIASHDLEIRGAGTLLGDSQSGAINDIGYSMYTDFLKDAIKTLKKNEIFSIDQSYKRGASTFPDMVSKFTSEVNLYTSALLPETWIPDVNLRLTLYKRIASASDDEALYRLQKEMRNRFGKLPEAAMRLIEITKLKLKATPLGIVKLNIGKKSGQVVFGPNADFDMNGLQKLIRDYPGTMKLRNKDSAIQLTHDMDTVDSRVAISNSIINVIRPVDQSLSPSGSK